MPRRIEPGTSLRVGIYSELDHADRAVERLLAAGFAKAQLTVICSDETRQRHFQQFEHQQPAGEHTPVAAASGSAIGVLVGSATAIVATLVTGGTAVLISGALGAWAGGVVGGLVGAMMTRGVEHELADYYDQAVTAGKILVAVDEHGPQAAEHLSVAERIFAEAGALPLPLRES
jgi:outer membrane lipoprotein SlyB